MAIKEEKMNRVYCEENTRAIMYLRPRGRDGAKNSESRGPILR